MNSGVGLTRWILRGAGVVLFVLAGSTIFARVQLSQSAVTLIIVGLSAILAGELFPRIQSLKLSATGVDIGLQDLSQSFTDQILELNNRIGKLELGQTAGVGRQRTLCAAASDWREPPEEVTEPGPYENDARKGKFGGKREAGGLRLDAEFPRSTDQWAEVKLIVRDKGGSDLPGVTAVEFFLDETFDAPRIKVPVIDKRAQLTITSWGGFTVGVWAPQRNATLELDLSKIRGAPRVMRED